MCSRYFSVPASFVVFCVFFSGAGGGGGGVFVCSPCIVFSLLCFVQVAPSGERAQVRDGDVGVPLRNLPAADAQQLVLGVLLRVRHHVPVHVGRDHGLGPAPMVREFFFVV